MTATAIDTGKPSDAERARWLPDTEAYVASLERAIVGQARALAVASREEAESVAQLQDRVGELLAANNKMVETNRELRRRIDDIAWWEGVYDGRPLTKEQIVSELHDYHLIISQVPKVYCAITNNLISKPNTTAEEVISAYEADVDRRVAEAIQEHDERMFDLGGDNAVFIQAVRAVIAERRRQIEEEGWTPEHDDEHSKGEIAAAAGCYALFSDAYPNTGQPPKYWPWHWTWWKPKFYQSALVRAAAMLIAEIERLSRAENRGLKDLGRCLPPS